MILRQAFIGAGRAALATVAPVRFARRFQRPTDAWRDRPIPRAVRNDLRAQGTQVMTLHMAFVDTDLTRGIDAPKSTPEAIVDYALDALEAGADEALADELTRQVHQGLSAEKPVYLLPR